MVIGIGADIVKVSRIRRFIGREEERPLDLILTSKEAQSRKNAHSVAGVFAVKEALLKALGIGFSRGLGRLLEIEVLKDDIGKPYVVTSGVVSEILFEKKISCIEVSISHDTDYAVAFVICQ
ncbi:MAG: holo-ACP synthase [Chitinophagaceae bacterium]|nr:holo-ACP synthase [Chitinophagaceae bacterium]